ncbi:MAG: formimidoylglutamate deiminase [Pseudomonadota bacterium]
MTTVSCASALLSDGWAQDVVLTIDPDGNIADIAVNQGSGASGCALPGIPNLHSHAHQRAMAGLAEKAGSTDDSFWTWRTIMYGFLDAIQPHHLHAIASQLYVEMLKAGYTHVAEFQYLHHQQDGSHFENIAEMSLQTLLAAQEIGIGITCLPVHYQFGGFGGQPVADQQRRFANSPDAYLRIVETLAAATRDDRSSCTGLTAHSLRAVTRETFGEILQATAGNNTQPVHIHIAEQTREVDDCVAWSGLRPVEYLYENFDVDHRWCLIHATHMTADETSAVAKSRAVAGLCPTTEANLGDGFFNATQYLQEGGLFGIGSDSHISISPVEELRWFEYGQRLMHRSRNQLSGGHNRSTGRNLFDSILRGGAQACGTDSGVIEVGKRADFIVLDNKHPLLAERHGDDLVDSWVFSGNENTVRDVFVGGRQVVTDGHHSAEEAIAQRFRDTIRELKCTL